MIELVDRLPTPDEYVRLRQAVGWRSVSREVARSALDGSLWGVCAEVEGQAVAMVRLVGDGSLYFYIQDLVVDPHWQHRGVGRIMAERLEARLAEQASEGAHVLLIAAPDVAGFYANLGYSRLDDDTLGKRINHN